MPRALGGTSPPRGTEKCPLRVSSSGRSGAPPEGWGGGCLLRCLTFSARRSRRHTYRQVYKSRAPAMSSHWRQERSECRHDIKKLLAFRSSRGPLTLLIRRPPNTPQLASGANPFRKRSPIPPHPPTPTPKATEAASLPLFPPSAAGAPGSGRRRRKLAGRHLGEWRAPFTYFELWTRCLRSGCLC